VFLAVDMFLVLALTVPLMFPIRCSQRAGLLGQVLSIPAKKSDRQVDGSACHGVTDAKRRALKRLPFSLTAPFLKDRAGKPNISVATLMGTREDRGVTWSGQKTNTRKREKVKPKNKKQATKISKVLKWARRRWKGIIAIFPFVMNKVNVWQG
jgi:hypothetical protein